MRHKPVVVGDCLWFAKGPSQDWEDAVVLGFDESRFAIADGASNGSFASHHWAQGLVDAFLDSGVEMVPSGLEAQLDRLHSSWLDRRPSGAVLGNQFDRGAFATFLGVSVEQHDSQLSWSAVAVGDCCLFHLRRGRLVGSFPMTDPNQFTNTPDLVSSLSPSEDVMSLGHYESREMEDGDQLLLMSDEIGQWALAAQRTEPEVWAFLSLLSQSTLGHLVVAERQDGRMKRDDVTLIRLRVRKAVELA